VPCLIDDGLTIFDSLAICEYINERYAAGRLWPRDPGARARARAVAAEMHSGFAPLRTHMSMDIRARYPERGAAGATTSLRHRASRRSGPNAWQPGGRLFNEF
jgi:glutathione S-transferase